jgi:WD40-like Beta Propeller Repeat
MNRLIFLLLAALLVLGLRGPSRGGENDAVKPINLDKLNTTEDENDPFVATDGLTLYYASNKSGTYGILISKRSAGKDPWPAGKPLLVSKDMDQRSPFLFKSDLYFASNEIPDEKLIKLRNFDIFKKIGMQAPTPLPGGGVNEKTDELHPWITPAGKEFYFSRKTDEGWKLMVASGPVPGPIGKVKEVGFGAGFHHATLSKDALTMYVQGLLKEGRWGLYRSKRDKVGAAWSEPAPLTALNHEETTLGDLSPSLSADGSKLYFASDRPGGKGGLDIWYVPANQLK